MGVVPEGSGKEKRYDLHLVGHVVVKAATRGRLPRDPGNGSIGNVEKEGGNPERYKRPGIIDPPKTDDRCDCKKV